MNETDGNLDRRAGLSHEDRQKLRTVMEKAGVRNRSTGESEESRSKETDRQILKLFNAHGLEAEDERLRRSTWCIDQSTVQTDPRYVHLIKNERLEEQVRKIKAFKWKGRPKKLFAPLQSKNRDVVEAVLCHGNQLQRHQFSLLHPDFLLEHELETLDAEKYLNVRMHPFATEHQFENEVQEVRTCGKWIFARDAGKTYGLKRRSSLKLSQGQTWTTPDVTQLVVGSEVDAQFANIACLASNSVKLLHESPLARVSMKVEAHCGTWVRPFVMLVGSRRISVLDWRTKTSTILRPDEDEHITDISQSPFHLCHFALTTSKPLHMLKVYDIRQMRSPLESLELAEHGAYHVWSNSFENKDSRFFEVSWPSAKEQWLLTSCLGGTDVVGRSKGVDGTAASSSFHHGIAGKGTSDPCIGAISAHLEDRWQSCLAFVRYMGSTGPTAIFLEPPEQTYSKQEHVGKMKTVGSFIQALLKSLVKCYHLNLDLTVDQQHNLAKRAFQIVEGCDVLGAFHAIWSMMHQELQDSIRCNTTTQFCVVVLNPAGDIQIAVSYAPQVVDLPKEYLLSLKSEKAEWLETYVESTWHCGTQHIIIPLFLGNGVFGFVFV